MKKLTDKTFAEEIRKSGGLYLLEVGAYYCGGCRTLSELLVKVAGTEKIPFAEMDATESPGTARELNIEKLPTTILFKDGQEVRRQVGPVNIPKLLHRPE